MCGEKSEAIALSLTVQGSPPRMRGKVLDTVIEHAFDGITPAYAGKSVRTCAVQSRDRDHLRVCGEKQAQMGCIQLSLGSPPRMRGKAAHRGGRSRQGGITPAYAGKRKPPPDRHKNWGDHPRMCGEKVRPTAAVRGVRGSPPHVRGKGWSFTQSATKTRITPACAGKSWPPAYRCAG